MGSHRALYAATSHCSRACSSCTSSRKFSVLQHVDELLATCSQSLFALRTLRQHGLSDDALVPGNCHQPSELRVSSLVGICLCGRPSSLGSVFTQIGKTGLLCQQFDHFRQHLWWRRRPAFRADHLLHRLLPPEREQHYSLRERSHNYQLPARTTLLKDKNFIIRMLYKRRDWLS